MPGSPEAPHIERLPGGLEVVVHGGADRAELASRVVADRAAVSERALRLMGQFLRDSLTSDGFLLDAIEVFADGDGGDFCLSYSWSTDGEPHEYGYTYFDVVFAAREPPQEPFWPTRFTVGFH